MFNIGTTTFKLIPLLALTITLGDGVATAEGAANTTNQTSAPEMASTIQVAPSDRKNVVAAKCRTPGKNGQDGKDGVSSTAGKGGQGGKAGKGGAAGNCPS